MEINGHNIYIEFQTVAQDQDWDSDGERFVRTTTGVIYCPDESDVEREIGRMEFHVIHLTEAAVNGFSLFDVFDSNRYLMTVFEEFFGPGDWWKKSYLNRYEDIFCQDTMMVLEHMKIDPAFRGHGLGLWAIEHAILNYGRDSIVVIQPFPLQYSGKMPKGEKVTRKKFLADRKRLVNYYNRGRFKFKQSRPNSDFWIFNAGLCCLAEIPKVKYENLPVKPVKVKTADQC
jgi:GNAT superfamily N-acetyltransferase